MRVIGGKRISGKTTELIKMSAASGATIVCVNTDSKNEVVRKASEMRVKIPPPITHYHLRRENGRGLKAVLIDDAEYWVGATIRAGLKVEAMTFSITEESDEDYRRLEREV